MLDGVQAFPDTYRFEIALPEILEELFFFIELVFAEDAVGKGLLGRIAEGDLADISAVVIVAEAPAGIVDDPGLVGKAVAEMAYRKREHVVEGFHDAEVGAVGGFLEAHELEDAHAFAADFAAELPDGQDIGIGIVGFDVPGRVEYLAEVAHQQQGGFGQFGEPAAGDGSKPGGREFLAEGFPDAFGLFGIGHDGMYLVAEQGKGLAGGEQGFGKGLAGVGIEQGGEQSFEGMVVEEDGHGQTG